MDFTWIIPVQRVAGTGTNVKNVEQKGRLWKGRFTHKTSVTNSQLCTVKEKKNSSIPFLGVRVGFEAEHLKYTSSATDMADKNLGNGTTANLVSESAAPPHLLDGEVSTFDCAPIHRVAKQILMERWLCRSLRFGNQRLTQTKISENVVRTGKDEAIGIIVSIR
jgi:hypothetical protein